MCIGALANAVDNRQKQKLNFKNQPYGLQALSKNTGKDGNRFVITSDVLAILFHFRCIDTCPEKQRFPFLSALSMPRGGRNSDEGL